MTEPSDSAQRASLSGDFAVQSVPGAPSPRLTLRHPPADGAANAGVSALGAQLRGARRDAGLTLEELGRRAGCVKSYLSAIERGVPTKRLGPPPRPSDDLLHALELALGLPPGRLLGLAHWQRTPGPVRREVETLHDARRHVRRLADALRAAGPRGLDDLHRSGTLARLIALAEPAEPADEAAPGASAIPVALPVEIPLINSVAAGYPREFTDLGYPARTADQYVRAPDICDPDAFAARVVGDSMEPTYREGDVVVFSPARPLRSGADCFIRLERDQETTFKRVFLEHGPAGEELLRLQPLNPRYAPRLFACEDVAGVYVAVSVMRTIG